MAEEPKPQVDKFRDLACELEAEARFEETVRNVVTPPKAEESDTR